MVCVSVGVLPLVSVELLQHFVSFATVKQATWRHSPLHSILNPSRINVSWLPRSPGPIQLESMTVVSSFCLVHLISSSGLMSTLKGKSVILFRNPFHGVDSCEKISAIMCLKDHACFPFNRPWKSWGRVEKLSRAIYVDVRLALQSSYICVDDRDLMSNTN